MSDKLLMLNFLQTMLDEHTIDYWNSSTVEYSKAYRKAIEDVIQGISKIE